MRLIESVYDLLVNSNADIAKEYQRYVKDSADKGNIEKWLYLLNLNINIRVFHKKINEYDRKNLGIELCLKKSESAMSYHETPAEFAKRISAFDIICFDIFDTLIFRPFLHPTDMFLEMENEFKLSGFRDKRIECERRARYKKIRTGSGEVTIKEIWEELEKKYGISADYGINVEKQTELQYCFANPYMKTVIEILRNEGKRLVILSDMYLEKEFLEFLLSQCGLGKFDMCFVSCDQGCSKSDGRLYEKVKNSFGKKASYVQIGDNYHSDIKQAQKHGFTAFYYENVNETWGKYRLDNLSEITGSVYGGLVNEFLHNGLNEYTPEFEYGFIYGGLFCVGLCQQIHCGNKQRAFVVDKIIDLFPAWSRKTLNLVYQYMYSEDLAVTPIEYMDNLKTNLSETSEYKFFKLLSNLDNPQVLEGIMAYVKEHKKRIGFEMMIADEDLSKLVIMK